MKTLMTATALAALVTASSAFGQAQDPAQDPLVGEPPAASESAPAPDAASPAPDAMPAEPATPDTGSEAQAPAAPDTGTADAEKFMTQQDDTDVLATTLIGTSVQNSAGEALGAINDVVIAEDGQVTALVIGVGGFLGMGEKNIGISFEAVEKSADANGNAVLVFDASAEELEAAPTFVTIAEMQQQTEQPAAPSDPMAPSQSP